MQILDFTRSSLSSHSLHSMLGDVVNDDDYVIVEIFIVLERHLSYPIVVASFQCNANKQTNKQITLLFILYIYKHSLSLSPTIASTDADAEMLALCVIAMHNALMVWIFAIVRLIVDAAEAVGRKNQTSTSNPRMLGWTGAHSTIKYIFVTVFFVSSSSFSSSTGSVGRAAAAAASLLLRHCVRCVAKKQHSPDASSSKRQLWRHQPIYIYSSSRRVCCFYFFFQTANGVGDSNKKRKKNSANLSVRCTQHSVGSKRLNALSQQFCVRYRIIFGLCRWQSRWRSSTSLWYSVHFELECLYVCICAMPCHILLCESFLFFFYCPRRSYILFLSPCFTHSRCVSHP